MGYGGGKRKREAEEIIGQQPSSLVTVVGRNIHASKMVKRNFFGDGGGDVSIEELSQWLEDAMTSLDSCQTREEVLELNRHLARVREIIVSQLADATASA